MTRNGLSVAGMPSEEAMRAILPMAALFHDVGKCTTAFQEKIRRAINKAKPEADPLRHEIWSVLFLEFCVAQSSDFTDFLKRCKAASFDFALAAQNAAQECVKLHSHAPSECPKQNTNMGAILNLPKIVEMKEPVLSAISDLILVHHRLPYLVDGRRSIVPHVNKGKNEPKILIQSFEAWPGTALWVTPKWKQKLAESANRLENLPPNVTLPDTAVIMRTAFMVADHTGSKSSVLLDRELTDCDLLANTMNRDGRSLPADTLAVHTERVRRSTFDAIKLLSRDLPTMPFLSADEIPNDIKHPQSSDNQFAWQAAAAAATEKLVSSAEGGFFACLIAGTGTGKTRAGPTILAAATLNDANFSRRSLRFTLGLGLRTLAAQSGNNFIDDFGFLERDVAVVIGGKPVKGIDEPSTELGNSDYLTDAYRIRVETAEDWFPDRDFLPSSHEFQLPPRILNLLDDNDSRTKTMRLLLASPILVTTVDHIMPVTDARRSRHLVAALRVLSGDVILDEIDQYSEEDLAALSRLSYWVGIGGRRLIIMSATIPKDVAQDLHQSYSAGWKRYAATVCVPHHVHTLVCGDSPKIIRTNSCGEAFSNLFATVSSHTCKRLERQPSQRLLESLPINAITDAPKEIWRTMKNMHDRHKTDFGSHRISVGLIRITRIDDLRMISRSLNCKSDESNTATLFVFLHSRMLRRHRTSIETALRKALTRKGQNANRGIIAFLRDHASAFLHDSEVTDIRIAVVSSPVIETGNDLDFDYAIIDPLNVRSIVQTAGRVNRHRCTIVERPNIAVLSSPLPCFSSKKMRLERPGIETTPPNKTGVQSCDLPHPVTFPDSFVSSSAFPNVNASWILNPDLHMSITNAEAKMRKLFRFGPGIGTQDFSQHPDCRLSASFGLRRKFRRSTPPYIEIFLERKNRELKFVGYSTGYSSSDNLNFSAKFLPSKSRRIILGLESESQLDKLIAEQRFSGNVVQIPYAQAQNPEGLVIHGALGVMTDQEAENLQN